MATNKINVVEKTPGTHIEYALSGGKKITFGDDAVSYTHLDVYKRQEQYSELGYCSWSKLTADCRKSGRQSGGCGH